MNFYDAAAAKAASDFVAFATRLGSRALSKPSV
jgi:hypothetical protein